jgi:exopolysaccharide biosynthesis polyprenyl glycosylphosphotransferase
LIAPAPSIDTDFVKRLSWDPVFAGVDLYLAPQLTDVTGPRTLLQGVPDLPFIHLESPQLSEWAKFIKRTFDFGFSLVLLAVLWPILLLIAIIISLTSRSAPLFTQLRVGENGKLFKIIKFRTMYLGADERRTKLRQRTKQRVGTFKMKDDPRVTPFGRFLRRWSLDELPQLFNVLIGSMSVVGPRPHPIDDVERYGAGDEIRLQIKPGLTGLQQVSGRSELSWEDSVRADLRYIENWSFSGDILLILRTFRVVATGQGAYLSRPRPGVDKLGQSALTPWILIRQ